MQNISNTFVHVYVQYTGDKMRLIDGFSHSIHGPMSQEKPRKLYFPVFNAADVEIFLLNVVGEYKALVKLVKYS